MPKLSHVQLQEWYAKFKKAVYESSNIDMDRINEPFDMEGDLMYACIPHNELDYDEEPPTIEQGKERMEWVMSHLQIPVTDKQIQKLYDMSREGTLMSFLPGEGEAGMQQVYTDASNNIRVSLPINVTELTDSSKLDPEYRIPDILTLPVAEPDPQAYGLSDAPPLPEKPKNLEPGFWSWVGYLIGFNTDYAKLKRYQDYDARFKDWFNNLDENNPNPDHRVKEYKAEKIRVNSI